MPELIQELPVPGELHDVGVLGGVASDPHRALVSSAACPSPRAPARPRKVAPIWMFRFCVVRAICGSLPLLSAGCWPNTLRQVQREGNPCPAKPRCRETPPPRDRRGGAQASA